MGFQTKFKDQLRDGLKNHFWGKCPNRGGWGGGGVNLKSKFFPEEKLGIFLRGFCMPIPNFLNKKFRVKCQTVIHFLHILPPYIWIFLPLLVGI